MRVPFMLRELPRNLRRLR